MEVVYCVFRRKHECCDRIIEVFSIYEDAYKYIHNQRSEKDEDFYILRMNVRKGGG